ncbi:MAG: phosphoglucosamine mutase [Oscillospiraceae bacterium]|jgi:phosphoglucosamine mutase|nr:phosphoglucosamine mutase [Oscillospiraceae bacterium]
MKRLFGTDGVRGIANVDLTAQKAFAMGQAAALVLTGALRHKPVIYIGKDTRISGDMLEAALTAGITSAGADVLLAGVIPTPAAAILTRERADAGIVVSASHNPYEDNGIKIFDNNGAKLSDALEDEIETLLRADMPLKTHSAIGRVRQDKSAAERYIDFLLACNTPDLSRLRVVVDCANGAASVTAKKLFSMLNAKDLRVIHNVPNGLNINDRCGSTYLESLRETVADGGYDIGIAFDGDADRCLCVDHTGKVVDGDRIMAACATRERERGYLPHDAFVCTPMTNLGLHVWARRNGLRTVTVSSVGDRYVLEEMQRGGYALGGEQSGHIIFLRHSAAGDGQLTALKLLSVMAETGQSLAGLAEDVPQYPQVLLNVAVDPESRQAVMSHPAVLESVRRAEDALGEDGRILLRLSGTEALVRVMVEGRDGDEVGRFAEEIAACVMRSSQPAGESGH